MQRHECSKCPRSMLMTTEKSKSTERSFEDSISALAACLDYQTPQERVAIVAPSSPGFGIACMAAMAADKSVLVIETAQIDTAAQIVRNAGITTVLTTRKYCDALRGNGLNLVDLEYFIPAELFETCSRSCQRRSMPISEPVLESLAPWPDLC